MAVQAQQDIGRGDISMNDIERVAINVRCLVRGVQPSTGIRDYSRCHAVAQWSHAVGTVQDSSERVTRYPLDRQKENAILASELVGLTNVWMLNRRRNRGLV